MLAKFVLACVYVCLALTFYSTTVFLSALSVSVLFLRNSFMLIKALMVIEADAALLTFPRKPEHWSPEASTLQAKGFQLFAARVVCRSVAHSQRRLEVPES